MKSNARIAPLRSSLQLALVGMAVAVLAGCTSHAEKHEVTPAAVIPVRETILAATPEGRRVEAVGSLRAARTATLSARIMGSVLELRKEAGDPIRRGEVLVVIDPREVSGQIAQAEGALAQARAALTLAETNFSRFDGLFTRGSASQLELDSARYQRDTAAGAVKQAEGAVETARSYRAYSEVAAPFDGRVVDRKCEVGDLATPGRPLLEVEDAREIRLYVALAEDELALATVGGTVAVTVPALGDREFEGRVAEIVPSLDPATRTFLVKLDLPSDAALRAGLFARARFLGGSAEVVRLPRNAMVRRGSLTGAFTIEDGKAAFRLLVLDDQPGSEPRIVSGLDAGARVILDPPATLENGSPVEVRS
ncbi:MAG: efflux RND transporter periplasmic adaptor subunit [Candidatus Eisenbacteria bacterium]|nr:efflux RND transporter periplasmic adaptor subunit [Candidatus Eisenbacteria bacterium]MCC7141389.1 efflux RND transporter periplasmic adaptor subunit [Candidatus Eisenbacteria bacterium]